MAYNQHFNDTIQIPNNKNNSNNNSNNSNNFRNKNNNNNKNNQNNKKNNKNSNSNNNSNNKKDKNPSTKPTTQRAVDTNVVSVGPFSFEKSLISIIVDAQDKDIQPSFNKIINNAEKEGRLLSTSEQPRTYIFLNNGFIIASKNRTETLIKKMF